MESKIFLIVGLGNPEPKYENTIHNLGFRVVCNLAQRLGGEFKKKECDSKTAHIAVLNKKLILALPQTYMNLSGFAVEKLMAKYKIPLSNIIIVFDDVDIEKGMLRYRDSGSGGTHNGMKNIVEIIDSEQIARLRIGAGRAPQHIELKDYVLSKIAACDEQIFQSAIEAASESLAQKIREFMQK